MSHIPDHLRNLYVLTQKEDWDLAGKVREMAKKAQLHEICNKEPWSILETTE